MPTRPNPYHTSPATYGSSGLAPSGNWNSGGASTLPLAQLVGTIFDAATYDPSMDPQRQSARAEGLKADALQRGEAARSWVGNNAGNKDIPLADLVIQSIQHGGGIKDAGEVGLLGNALRADPTTDIGNTLDRYSVLRGDAPNQTMSSSTYGRRMAPEKVIGDNGQPVVLPTQDAYGRAPVLNDSEAKGQMLGDLAASLSGAEKKAVVGAEPKEYTPYNYIGADGKGGSTTNPGSVTGPGVTVFSGSVQGAKPGDLTTGVKTQVQEADLAQKNFGDILNITRDVATKDPTLFGVAGEGRRLVQDVTQQIKNAGLVADGKDLEGTYNDVVQSAAAKGIKLPDVNAYDPNLSNIVKLSHILTYNAAEVFANQQGRSVSDKDVQKFQKVVGDPGSWLSSQQSFLSGLDLMQGLLDTKQKRTDAALGKASPAAAPSTTPSADIRIDAQGNIIQ